MLAETTVIVRLTAGERMLLAVRSEPAAQKITPYRRCYGSSNEHLSFRDLVLPVVRAATRLALCATSLRSGAVVQVIDRLLKIGTHWKIVMIFDPRRTRSCRGTAPQFCGPTFINTGCSDRRCAVRAFGDSTARRSAPPPRADPAETLHVLAGGFDNRTTGSTALFSRG
jgi:hypothetical protein